MHNDGPSPRFTLGHWLILLAALVIGLFIPFALWLGITGAIAADSMQKAKSDIARAQAAVANQNDAQVRELVPAITGSTSSAHAMVSGPVWNTARRLPFVGATASALTDSITAVDIAAQGALLPLSAAIAQVRSGSLLDSDGSINLAQLSGLQRPMNAAAAAITEASALASAAPKTGVVDSVASETENVATQLTGLRHQILAVGEATEVLPSMLGRQDRQRYFVAFTSPAEARGTGGFLGTFGILNADKGKLSVERLGSNTELNDFTAPVVDLGEEYTRLYSNNSALWSGMNLSPHFPFAAKQWIEGWKRQTGEQLQGALAVDPATLSYLMGVTGPITLPDGEPLTSTDVVPFLANGVYQRFASDNAARKKFQVTVADRAINGLIAGEAHPQLILTAMARAASERRLLVYSADPTVQRVIEQWPLSGIVDTTPGPYAMLVVNNLAGNKADYFLDRSLTYRQVSCGSPRVDSQITAILTNNLPPSGNAPAVIYRGDPGAGVAKPLSTRVSAEILLPIGAGITSATLNGEEVPIASISEAGRPGTVFSLDLERAKPVTLLLNIREPVSVSEPRVPVQPLVRPQLTAVSRLSC